MNALQAGFLKWFTKKANPTIAGVVRMCSVSLSGAALQLRLFIQR